MKDEGDAKDIVIAQCRKTEITHFSDKKSTTTTLFVLQQCQSKDS